MGESILSFTFELYFSDMGSHSPAQADLKLKVMMLWKTSVSCRVPFITQGAQRSMILITQNKGDECSFGCAVPLNHYQCYFLWRQSSFTFAFTRPLLQHQPQLGLCMGSHQPQQVFARARPSSHCHSVHLYCPLCCGLDHQQHTCCSLAP